jgi:FMN phosphatase YigB (HAD superfamily)
MQPANIRADPQRKGPVEEFYSDKSWREHLTLHLRMRSVDHAAIEAIAQELLSLFSTYQASKALVPDAISTLEHLAKSGYRLGLLSNRMEPICELAETLGIAGYFELISSGGEISLLKPDPRFFFRSIGSARHDA